MSRGSENSSEVLPFWNYPELRPSPRIRSLLDGVYQTSWGLIGPGLRLVFRSVQEQIRAQSAVPRPDSVDWSERHRALQHCEPAFVQAVKRRLQHSLLVLAAPPWADQRLAADLLEGEAPQHLTESNRHREQMLLAQMSARAEVRIGSGLASLAWRLAAIQSAAPAEPEDLVLGPYWLAGALSAALDKGPPNTDDRRLLLRGMEQELYLALPRIVQAVDAYLSGHQVLPRIERFLASPGDVGYTGPTTSPSDPGSTDAGPTATHGSTAQARPTPAVMPERTKDQPSPLAPNAQSEAASAPLGWDGPATRALRELAMRDESAPQVAGTEDMTSPEDENIDGHTIAKIWEFLGQRHNHPGALGSEGSAPTASSREVLGALHSLQQRSNRQFAYNARADGPRDRDLRRDLLNELRELTRTSAPRLADGDANVIALVGRLFGELLAPWPPTSRAYGLLARLEVPVVKAALLDKSFFMDPNQRARAFLEAVASACAEWIEDEEADRAVVERIEVTVDQLCNAYESDLASFQGALGELEKQLGALRKRSDISIRRQVEALQGREKLELARLAAREIIQGSVSNRTMPPLVELFMKNAWTDSIALAVLRHGIDSDITRERAGAANTLARHFDNLGSIGPGDEALVAIESVVREGLGAVGFHSDAVHGAWRELIELGETGRPDPTAATPHLSELAHSLTRLGGGKSGDGQDDATSPLRLAGAETEARGLPGQEELRPGLWLDVRTYPEGSVRRLLAWRSQVSRRILLADRRGTRVEEWDLADLMKSIAAKEVCIRTVAAGNKVAHALRQGLARGEQA